MAAPGLDDCSLVLPFRDFVAPITVQCALSQITSPFRATFRCEFIPMTIQRETNTIPTLMFRSHGLTTGTNYFITGTSYRLHCRRNFAMDKFLSAHLHWWTNHLTVGLSLIRGFGILCFYFILWDVRSLY